MKKLIAVIFIIMVFTAASEKHFISDNAYREKVEKRFEFRKKFASARSNELFSVFEKDITTEESEALKFLYAYMPLNDLADYNGGFFLKLVKSSFEARETFHWCKTIPEDIFRHFVLPYRVNNENLDSARMVFLRELKDRIKNLSMKEAALEVNHWCHEKVNYKASDIRTSAPLSTVRTSHGRCGEESTFTVTALRAVGIPARQVYTPRWAHCDDNHAWVEVWVDGKWSYLGACEPEPELNIGWFSEPVRRAMMVHTKVFGNYTGNEEVLKKTENFTEINVTSNYTDVKRLYVKVIDENSAPVENAQVDFGLYNYAEFYPIASKMTDKNGITYSSSGMGDLMIWGTKDGKFDFRKVSVSDVDTVVLKPANKINDKYSFNLDIHPPVEKEKLPVNQEKKAQNDKRLKYEDSIRTAYIATFIDEKASEKFAGENSISKELSWKYLKQSEGNWREIKLFIESAKKQGIAEEHIFAMLANIAAKDLRDTKAEILLDHMKAIDSSGKYNKDIFYPYVLNPRIKNENLVSYKNYLASEFGKYAGLSDEQKINSLINSIRDNIKINDPENYYNLPATPVGVHQLKISNMESRDIYFVAVCRSLGIPSRLEETRKIPQYYNGKEWMNVYFEKAELNQPDKGFITLVPKLNKLKIEPLYYIHFTLAKLVNGIFKTLEFPDETKLSEMKGQIALETGYYRLITGNRMPDGTVLSNITHFTLGKNEVKKIPLVMQVNNARPEVLAKISPEEKLTVNGKSIKIKELASKGAAVISWIEPDKEPTKHFFVGLAGLKSNYEKLKGSLCFIVPEEKQTSSFSKETVKGLPDNVKIVLENNETLLKSIKQSLKIEKISFPFVLIINKNGEIIYTSQGYKIGLGEQLLKLM